MKKLRSCKPYIVIFTLSFKSYHGLDRLENSTIHVCQFCAITYEQSTNTFSNLNLLNVTVDKMDVKFNIDHFVFYCSEDVYHP